LPAAALLGLAIIGCCGCGGKLPAKSVASGGSAGDVEPGLFQKKLPIAGKKILLVQSYHAEYPWVASITAGVKAGLEGSGVELEIFYMDTKRRTDEAWKIQAGKQAERKVADFKPDLIITADDNAQQYFAMKYVDGKIPIVFTGVNADPSKYGYPAKNITGIIERPNFQATLEYLRQFTPAKKVAILSNDDETSRGAFNFMKQMPVPLKVTEYKRVRTFEEWRQAVKKYNSTVDAFGIYTYHTLRQQGKTESMDPKTVMRWTRENTRIPTFGFFDFGIGDGLLCGVVESGFEYGEKAADYAREILQGTPISSLPVIQANTGERMINRDAAKKLGITLTPGMMEGAKLTP